MSTRSDDRAPARTFASGVRGVVPGMEREPEIDDREDQTEEEGGDDGELDRRGSALTVDPTAPGAGMREPRAAVERLRGSLEHGGAL